ncbi:hypothetical protein ACLMJK_006208 [Lecanora helva]
MNACAFALAPKSSPNPESTTSNRHPMISATNNTLEGSHRIRCDEPNQGWERPLFTDCEAAIRQLPIYPTVQGTFHYVGSLDAYRLPVTRRVGTCKIMVELWNGQSDIYTWPAITDAALTLGRECRKTGSVIHGWKMKTGGKSFVGLKGSIGIYLFKATGGEILGAVNSSREIGELGSTLVESA